MNIVEFEKSVREVAQKIKVNIGRVSFMPANKKWGYCANKDLFFSINALDLDDRLREYVILHELVHVDVPNHGMLWKARMGCHMSDWDARHAELSKSKKKVYGKDLF